MKFRLNLPTFTQPKAKVLAARKQKVDTKTVETWNELRLIGTEGVYRKKFAHRHADTESILSQDDNTMIMEEAQDWDNLIAQFNEQYREQVKHGHHHDKDDDESISTLAETKSQLLQNRHRRHIIYRKCFIITCLMLWVRFKLLSTVIHQINAHVANHEWYLVYHIYPVGFLQELDIGIVSQYFNYKIGWTVFGINMAIWAVGSIGILLALCFHHKSQLLKHYVLRAPISLVLPCFLILVSVRFNGLLSTEKLSAVLDAGISKYHETYDSESRNFSRREWNKLQNAMQCCGVQRPMDWIQVDNNMQDDKTYIPESCCAKEHFRKQWKKEIPERDDCYYKINSTLYEWAYPEGCLNKAYEFYVKRSAFQVGLRFFQFLNLIANFAVGKQLYTMVGKCNTLRFKYSWSNYMSDMFCMKLWCCIFRCCCVNRFCRKARDKLCSNSCKCCDKRRKQPRPTTITDTSWNTDERSLQDSTQDTISIEGKSRQHLPSVIVTAPLDAKNVPPKHEILIVGDPDDEAPEVDIPPSFSDTATESGLITNVSSLLNIPENKEDTLIEGYALVDENLTSVSTEQSATESRANKRKESKKKKGKDPMAPSTTISTTSVATEKQDAEVKDSLMNMFSTPPKDEDNNADEASKKGSVASTTATLQSELKVTKKKQKKVVPPKTASTTEATVNEAVVEDSLMDIFTSAPPEENIGDNQTKKSSESSSGKNRRLKSDKTKKKTL